MLKVCIDYSSAIAHSAGVSRYVQELTDALATRNGEVSVALVHNTPQPSRTLRTAHSLPRTELRYGIKAWRAMMLGGGRLFGDSIARRVPFDLYHGPDCITPSLKAPVVLTIHDLTVLSHPAYHTRPNRLFMRLALPIMVRRASHIIADSESTKREIVARLKVQETRVTVIYPGINHSRFYHVELSRATHKIARLLHIDKPYVLALGTLEPRKNLITLLRAFAATAGYHDNDLVLAGAQGWGRTELDQTIGKLGISNRVRIIGFIADELLACLYSAAQAFVYPSWFEGFGFPVLEAMACGTAVICSNTSSIPEIAGEAALQCDPGDAEAMAAHLRALLSNPDQQQKLRGLGMKRAATFRWERTASETIQTYHRAARGKP